MSIIHFPLKRNRTVSCIYTLSIYDVYQNTLIILYYLLCYDINTNAMNKNKHVFGDRLGGVISANLWKLGVSKNILQSFHQVSVVACCPSCLVIQMVILLRILFHVLPGMKSSGVDSRLAKHMLRSSCH